MVTISRLPGPQPDDLAAAVDAALTPLLLLASRAAADASQRVSSSQLQALLALEHRGPLNLTGFADVLNVIPSSASRLCDRLVAADLVTRTTAETDRREVVLRLTSNGKKLVRQIRKLRREALDVALEQMAPRDRVSLLKGLTALGVLLNEEHDSAPGAAHG